MRKLTILTGASGSGKTALVHLLRGKFSHLRCLHFDEIGIPSFEAMRNSHGSVEAWQRAKTLEWIEKIPKIVPKDAYVVFEGQMRISYIKEALKIFNLMSANILLLDCHDEERRRRLHLRGHLSLADQEMMDWAAFLRREALQEIVAILDTTKLSQEEVLAAFLSRVALSGGKTQVALSPYDPKWPEIFDREAKRVRHALSQECMEIHHVGSTAVPGLLAKPIVDVLAVVHDLSKIDIQALEQEGFLTRGEVIPTGRYFKKPSVHLHIFEKGNPNIRNALAFRDWLRTCKKDKKAYATLKQRLAQEHPEHNFMVYCKDKTAYIEAILRKVD